MRGIWICFIGFVLLPVTAVAQEKETVSVRFMIFPRAADRGPLELKAGDEILKIEAASNRLSDPVEVPAAASWAFGRRIMDDEGEAGGFETWGECRPKAEGRKKIVLLLRQGRTNDAGLKVLCMNDGENRFVKKQMLFLNFSDRVVAGEVGKAKFKLEPGKRKVITPKPDKGENLCFCQLLSLKKDKWRPFLSTNWPIRENTRGIVLIYPDPRTSGIRVHTISDVPFDD